MQKEKLIQRAPTLKTKAFRDDKIEKETCGGNKHRSYIPKRTYFNMQRNVTVKTRQNPGAMRGIEEKKGYGQGEAKSGPQDVAAHYSPAGFKREKKKKKKRRWLKHHRYYRGIPKRYKNIAGRFYFFGGFLFLNFFTRFG